MLTTPSGKPASAISSAIFSERERRQLRRLHHDGVARGQRGRHLPAREHEREVPRHDLPDHADRLAQRVVQEARLDRNRLALELVGHAAEVAETRRRARHVERRGCRAAGGRCRAISSRASSSALASIRSASFSRMRPRSAAASGSTSGRRAAPPQPARSTSALPAIATSAMVELSCGFSVASVSPLCASTKRPSMNSWWRIGVRRPAAACDVREVHGVPGSLCGRSESTGTSGASPFWLS